MTDPIQPVQNSPRGEPDKADSPPATEIPEELVQQLHQANEQFHHAREHVEQAIGANVNALEERDKASREVKDAQQELEKLDERIRGEFNPKS